MRIVFLSGGSFSPDPLDTTLAGAPATPRDAGRGAGAPATAEADARRDAPVDPMGGREYPYSCLTAPTPR